jgi:hypothetical protein
MATVVRPVLPPAASAGVAGPVPQASGRARRPAGLPVARGIPVSATLAANEAMTARRRRGQPVLPLAFGEAGLPVHPALRDALADATGVNGYGPVAGHPALRSPAAGYWARRGLPTSPGQVVCGPGSKPLLFALLLAIGGDVALPRPCWVSYAAQAALIGGTRAHFVPAPAGEGGIPDPDALAAAADAAATVRPIRSVVVTLPDNPTGRAASPARDHQLACGAWSGGLACHLRVRAGFTGSLATKLSPLCTHVASASSAAKPAGSTQMKPDSSRPANCIGRTWGSRSAASRPSAPTRTISAVPVMPQHRLPLTKNDRPPTILFSTTPSRPDSSCRTRSAASGS